MRHRSPLPLVRIATLVALLTSVAVAVPAAGTDRVVVVQSGDTLSGIALRQGVSMAALLALNTIVDPDRIFPGQLLRIPAAAVAGVSAPDALSSAPLVHVVRSGEHLTGIARRYGTTIAALVAANRIANPSYLRVGQRLVIPGTDPLVPGQALTQTVVPSPSSAGSVHVVRSGEHLTGIARRYGTTIAALVAANQIANPSYLRVGQRLVIPGNTEASALSRALAAVSGVRPGMPALTTARVEIGSIIAAEAAAQGVPVPFALAVAWQESGWRADVVSRAGAVGVMQLMPATADWVARTMLGQPIDLRDAGSNVHAGIALVKHYLVRYSGDKGLALAAYYQGQTAADRHGIYPTTRPYIASVLALESSFAH